MSNNLLLMYALALARRGYDSVTPNPPVGALIVKDGEIISTGYHQEAGPAHAEVVALSKLSPTQAKGSTLYVSLEPCSHSGKTPPCTEAILNAGISRVIYGRSDLTKEAGGGGVFLKNKGVDVAFTNNKLCADFIKPWEDFKLINKKTIDCWAIVSLNGQMLKSFECLTQKYQSLNSTVLKFQKTLRKNVQTEVFESNLDHKGCYHFLLYKPLAEKFLNFHAAKRLHILRVPLITAKNDNDWTGLSNNEELAFIKAHRFGNFCYERYDIIDKYT